MNGKVWRIGLLLMILVAAVWILAPDVAMAAPGGLIKAAARSPLGRIMMGLMMVLLAPFILYYMVRSAIASRRTRADLQRLAATWPQYRWLDIQDRATETFGWVWSAWTQQKMGIASDYTTAWYWQNQQLQLDDWARRGLTNVCHVVKLQTISPLFVQHNPENGGEGSRIVVDIRARVVDYLQDANGQIVQGDKKEGDLDTVWTFLWQDGAWKLNKIEDGANEFTYLLAPNELPQAAGQPVRTSV